MGAPAPGFASLSRTQLATLVPELLLAGQLIDRASLGHVLLALGPDGMRDVAIDEWMGASPVYTRRMQKALRFEGDDVITLFKGLQLDIGAPPQFMDFRYVVHDRYSGQFELAHCGALMDVEPMGEGFVRRMCHDIEDPTFDATAIATNPRAQVRPIHRPPRVPAGRTPHCAWRVTIDDSHPPVEWPPTAVRLRDSEAGRFDGVSPIDPDDHGDADYSGPLLADVRFDDFSHSALVRIAEEVCLQMHLLVLSFRIAVGDRVDPALAVDITRKGFIGIAGLTAARLHAALGLPGGLEGAAALLAVHPALNPAGYAGTDVTGGADGGVVVTVRRDTPAHRDGAWPALIDAGHLDAIEAIVRAADPRLRAEVASDTSEHLVLRVVPSDVTYPEPAEVQVARVSTGATFAFADRGERRALPVVSR